MMIAGHMKKLFVAVCAITVVLFAASCTKEKSPSGVENKSPDFTLRDMRGGKVSLAGFRGRVVLLEFWATWCPPCRESIPELNELYKRYKDRGLVVLGISLDSEGDAASAIVSFMKEQPIIYPVLIDDTKASMLYSVSSIPALFLIDKNGNVVKRVSGFVPGLTENLSNDIERLL
ncbi:MAG TPA: thioredoxin [Nitrospiraceae bacterium]|jgi:peroxiredoxin|nr:thioredoxin [Nitrospiraceae bacterium]